MKNSYKKLRAKSVYIGLSLLITLMLYGNCMEVSLYELEEDESSKNGNKVTLFAKTDKLLLFTTLNQSSNQQNGLIEMDPSFENVEVQLSFSETEITNSLNTRYGQFQLATENSMNVIYQPNAGFRGEDEGVLYIHGNEDFNVGRVFLNAKVFNPRSFQDHYGLAVRATRQISVSGQFTGTLVTDFGYGLKDENDNDLFFGGFGFENIFNNTSVFNFDDPSRNFSLNFDSTGLIFLESTGFNRKFTGAPHLVVPDTPMPSEMINNWVSKVGSNQTLLEKGYTSEVATGSTLKDFFANHASLDVTSYNQIKIGAPTKERILEIFDQLSQAPNVEDYQVVVNNNILDNVLYVPEEMGVSAPISGLYEAKNNGVVYNAGVIPVGPYNETRLVCEGDIIIRGAARFSNLILESRTGCRIYATGLITLTAPIVVPSNIQFSSALMISIGLGMIDSHSCSYDYHYNQNNSFCKDTNTLKHYLGFSQMGRREYFWDNSRWEASSNGVVHPAHTMDSIYKNTSFAVDNDYYWADVSKEKSPSHHRSITSRTDFRRVFNSDPIDYDYADNWYDVANYYNFCYVTGPVTQDDRDILASNAADKYTQLGMRLDLFNGFENYYNGDQKNFINDFLKTFTRSDINGVTHYIDTVDSQWTGHPDPGNFLGETRRDKFYEDMKNKTNIDYILNLETFNGFYSDILMSSRNSGVNGKPIRETGVSIVNDSDLLDEAVLENDQKYPVLDASCSRPGANDIGDGYHIDSFEHVFINAPIVLTRVGGLFKGMIVAENYTNIDKAFIFEEDPIFSVVPLLPLLNFSEEVFKVE